MVKPRAGCEQDAAFLHIGFYDPHATNITLIIKQPPMCMKSGKSNTDDHLVKSFLLLGKSVINLKRQRRSANVWNIQEAED